MAVATLEIKKKWVFKVQGRMIYLYQKNETTGDLIYPDETIANGLMFEGTAFIFPFVTNDPNVLVGNNNPNLVEPATVDEDAHVNLPIMLTLAVIDYVKAQMAENVGNIEMKEYWMREFNRKVGDYQSNKMRRNKVQVSSPFGIR